MTIKLFVMNLNLTVPTRNLKVHIKIINNTVGFTHSIKKLLLKVIRLRKKQNLLQ